MRIASAFLLATLALTGCGAPALSVAQPTAGTSPAARAEAKITEAQRRQALALVAERLYGKDFAPDFQHNDAAVAKKDKNAQGNAAWFVMRDYRALEKAGHFAFLATEYTRDDAGTMQSQYKLTGTVDLKAGAVVDIKKEVEDRDPR